MERREKGQIERKKNEKEQFYTYEMFGSCAIYTHIVVERFFFTAVIFYYNSGFKYIYKLCVIV